MAHFPLCLLGHCLQSRQLLHQTKGQSLRPHHFHEQRCKCEFRHFPIALMIIDESIEVYKLSDINMSTRTYLIARPFSDPLKNASMSDDNNILQFIQ